MDGKTYRLATRNNTEAVLMLPSGLTPADVVDVTRWLADILAGYVSAERTGHERRSARAALRHAGAALSTYDDVPIGSDVLGATVTP